MQPYIRPKSLLVTDMDYYGVLKLLQRNVKMANEHMP